MKTIFSTSPLALAITLAAASHPALAASPDAPLAADAAPGRWTDTIVVTGMHGDYAVPDTSAATRTSTPLIEVPQSVQVLSRTLLQEQDRRTLRSEEHTSELQSH